LVFQRTNTITRAITVVVTLHACCGTVNPAPYIITRIHAKKIFHLSIQVVLSSSTNECNGKKHLQPRIMDLFFKQSINQKNDPSLKSCCSAMAKSSTKKLMKNISQSKE
jgi:hypothetical protein